MTRHAEDEVERRRSSWPKTAWLHLGRQLEGMDTHLERADAPGQRTAREVLGHLLFEPGWKAAALVERFAVTDLPVVDITPGWRR